MAKSASPMLAILERLPVTSVISNPQDGRILWATLRDLPLVAASDPDQLIGRSLMEFLRPEQHAVALRDIEAVARGESPPPVTYHLRRVDGGYSDVQIATVPIVWDGAVAMLSMVTDVTERESALRSLAESEERYRDLVESLPDGIVVVVRNKVVFANAVLAEKLGLGSPDELIGASMLDFIAPEEVEVVRKSRDQVIRSKGSFPQSPVTLQCKNGQRLATTASTTYVHWQGESATQTVMRDLRSARSCSS